MVEIDWRIVLVQLVTFLIGMYFIWNSLIKALRNNLKNRDEFIRNGIDKVEKDKKDIEEMKADYEKQMLEAQAHVKATLEKAAAEGEKTRQELVSAAKFEGVKLIENAKREIEAEKVKALEEVKDRIVDIAIMATERIVKAGISKKAQTDIVEEAIKELDKN
jgi:F-type H+-transporting ATPase subunit b